MCTTHAWTVAVHDRQLELAALALALRELDAASHAAEAALLRAYPLMDEDPFFDPHAIDEDPHEAAAEVGFLIRSLRLSLQRYGRLTRPARPAATRRARRAATQPAR